MMARGCAAAWPRAAQARSAAPPQNDCKRTFELICLVSANGRAITRGGRPNSFSWLAIAGPDPRGTIS